MKMYANSKNIVMHKKGRNQFQDNGSLCEGQEENKTRKSQSWPLLKLEIYCYAVA